MQRYNANPATTQTTSRHEESSAQRLELSVVVPLYNEAENVVRLHEALRETLSTMDAEYEILYVDDGSSDETLPALQTIAEQDPSVRVLKMRRNFGQTAAMCAGIDYAQGRTIVTMDGDLQNDPRDIPLLLSKIAEGYDLVTGWRRDRKDALLSRKVPSKIANWMIARVTGVPIHDNGCSLKAYRADMIKRVPLYSEMHRFIPAMCTLAGARIAEIVVRHHPRRAGQTKYGLSRIGRVLLDVLTVKMLISFSRRPLHWFGLLSTPFLLFGAVAGLYSVYEMMFAAKGYATIIFPAVTLLFAYLGIHLVFTGILGELAVGTNAFEHVKPLWRCTRVRSKHQG